MRLEAPVLTHALRPEGRTSPAGNRRKAPAPLPPRPPLPPRLSSTAAAPRRGPNRASPYRPRHRAERSAQRPLPGPSRARRPRSAPWAAGRAWGWTLRSRERSSGAAGPRRGPPLPEDTWEYLRVPEGARRRAPPHLLVPASRSHLRRTAAPPPKRSLPLRRARPPDPTQPIRERRHGRFATSLAESAARWRTDSRFLCSQGCVSRRGRFGEERKRRAAFVRAPIGCAEREAGAGRTSGTARELIGWRPCSLPAHWRGPQPFLSRWRCVRTRRQRLRTGARNGADTGLREASCSSSAAQRLSTRSLSAAVLSPAGGSARGEQCCRNERAPSPVPPHCPRLPAQLLTALWALNGRIPSQRCLIYNQ